MVPTGVTMLADGRAGGQTGGDRHQLGGMSRRFQGPGALKKRKRPAAGLIIPR